MPFINEISLTTFADVDFGFWKFIADGRVKVKQGASIERLTSTSIVFDDGTELITDAIVLA